MEKQNVKDEIAARFSKKNWLVKALPIAYCAIGVLLMTAVPVYADDIFATAKNVNITVRQSRLSGHLRASLPEA